MKSYPSITRSTGQSFHEFDAYVFDKLDGSNLRFEWARKSGWCKYGTRTRLLDATDDVFGPAIPLFYATMAEHLENVFREKRWERAIAFMEYHGPTTLGGLQKAEDDHSQKQLTLFDVAPYKQGLLGPTEYLKLFGDWDRSAAFLGKHRWSRGFVERVRTWDVPGITHEGVIGKAGDGKNHDLIMAKAKTQAWIDAIMARYGDADGAKIVES